MAATGFRIFSLTNKYLKYQMLAYHFAVTNCYTCLYQQPKYFKLSIQYSTGVASRVTWNKKRFLWPFSWNYNLTC